MSQLLLAAAYRLTDPELIQADQDPALARPTDRQAQEKTRILSLLTREPVAFDPHAAAAAWGAYAPPQTEYDCLQQLAEQLIELQCGQPRIKRGSAWSLVARVVDPDALAAWHLGPDLPEGPRRACAPLLTWPPVLRYGRGAFERVLSRAMVEGHLHLGGALPPSLLWALAMSGVVPHDRILPAGRAEPEGIWSRKLFLAEQQFLELLRTADPGCDAGAAERGAARAEWARSLPFDGAEEEVAQARRAWPFNAAPVCRSILLSSLFTERWLLCRILRELRKEDQRELPAPLTAYLKIKNSFHHALVHDRGTRGLNRFRQNLQRREFYFLPAAGHTRSSRARGMALEQRRVAQTIEWYLRDAAGISLAAVRGAWPRLDLELRVTLPNRREAIWSSLRAWAWGICDGLRTCADGELRVGLVVHVHKRAPDFRAPELQAEQLISLLKDVPDLRPLIVGIDAASDELAAPPRRFAALYADLRSRTEAPAPDSEVWPIRLGFTYHVGEDFEDLLTGIRHVDEAAHLLALRPGDRLGHGLALAWAPADFYARRPRVFPSVGDHALDLLWAWCLLRREPEPRRTQGARARELLQQLLARHAVAGGPQRIETAAVRLDPSGPLPGQGSIVRTEEELKKLLGLARVLDRVELTTPDSAWQELVSTAQDVARSRLLARNLIIELNPTSNLTIGGFRSFRELPYLRLSRFGLPRPTPDQPDLPISLNTDDPGLFLTSLRNEYEQLGECLLEQGHPIRPVTAWLEEARQVGLASGFIPPWAPAGQQLLAHLRRLTGDAWFD